ncbi:methyl-accepting chemotaxis protein [Geotalea uraniireducens]|uniref:Methyl-accepting chemotaxis sensory transducer n=1 Tax=Geotalea uraniireducens (strain Rf4) TaxID=351605 RepID=A5GB89_GEOUR|nr:methyl-accepting chemotaxis protein [Geotalea uraniireducens]ABQ25166.1 methyl-accepting chemotaxis sensory transducer [Geotalea uraniireducens Rf4]
MKSIFVPAIVLMNRCTFFQKIAVVTGIFLLPVMLLAYFLVTDAHELIEFAAKERLGVEYSVPVRRLLQDAQGMRDSSVITGDVSAEEAKLASDFQNMEKVEERLSGDLNTKDALTKLKNTANSIKSTQGKAFGKIYAAHTVFISELLSMLTLVADNSNLTLDPDIDSYYLMDSIATKLPGLAEAVSRESVLVREVLARKAMTPEEKTELTVVSGQITALLDGLRQNMSKAFGANADLRRKLEKNFQSIENEVAAYAETINRDLLGGKENLTDPAGFAAAAKRAAGAVYQGYDIIVPELDHLLNKRINKLHSHTNRKVMVSFMAVLLGMYLFLGFYRSVRDNIHELHLAAQQVAEGNLNMKLAIPSRDEIGAVSRSFNAMVGDLGDIVGKVSITATQVATAASQLTSTADKIAMDSENVAIQATAVATASEQMLETSTDIARSCCDAAGNSQHSNRIATSGVAVLKETLTVMEGIASRVKLSATSIGALEARSNSIGEIVSTIEDIADQTNLLALNAAIEAARAGEQGRGFAVVADEVRALAERTTVATRQISEMIGSIQKETRSAVEFMDSGVQEVGNGMEKAAESEEALKQIFEQIDSVSTQISQIAGAAEEQTATTNVISKSIQEMNAISYETAGGAKESAAAASQLSDLSCELKSLVMRFRLA